MSRTSHARHVRRDRAARHVRRTGAAWVVAATIAATGFVGVTAATLSPASILAAAASGVPATAEPSPAPTAPDEVRPTPPAESDRAVSEATRTPAPTASSEPAPARRDPAPVHSDPAPEPTPDTVPPSNRTSAPPESAAPVPAAPITSPSAAAVPSIPPQAPSVAPKCVPGLEAIPASERGYVCGEADSHDPETTTQPVSAIAGEVRMAVVGDSISSGSTRRLETLAQADAGTWVSTAILHDKVAYAGGWAQWGSTSTEQANAVYPVTCDVLVLLTGTNNIRSSIDFDQQMLDMNHIANVIGAPRVLVLAIPPNDKFASESLVRDRNLQLQKYAAIRGWDFHDPWTGFRNGERWVAGTNLDEYHPTNATHAVIGQRIGDYIAGHYAG